jgi:hypothetical protein
METEPPMLGNRSTARICKNNSNARLLYWTLGNKGYRDENNEKKRWSKKDSDDIKVVQQSRKKRWDGRIVLSTRSIHIAFLGVSQDLRSRCKGQTSSLALLAFLIFIPFFLSLCHS